MREAPVEKRLKDKLEQHGFKVLKLVTPGTAGAMDRMILPPLWSPGPPWFVELKAPRKHEARHQQLTRDEWRGRGLQVLDMCDTYDRVDTLVEQLLHICKERGT